MSNSPSDHPSPQPRLTLCPYCGAQSGDPHRCDACSGLFEPLSRQATQNGMGPWFIRDESAPFRPGCSFETLRRLIQRGKVTSATVIRGPTTRQFWAAAGTTPGVANLLGRCHNCGKKATADQGECDGCGASFAVPTDRQRLGLAPVRLLPGQASPEAIAAHSASSQKASEPVRRSAPVPGTTDPSEEHGDDDLLRPARRRRRSRRGWKGWLAITGLLGGAAIAALLVQTRPWAAEGPVAAEVRPQNGAEIAPIQPPAAPREETAGPAQATPPVPAQPVAAARDREGLSNPVHQAMPEPAPAVAETAETYRRVREEFARLRGSI